MLALDYTYLWKEVSVAEINQICSNLSVVELVKIQFRTIYANNILLLQKWTNKQIEMIDGLIMEGVQYSFTWSPKYEIRPTFTSKTFCVSIEILSFQSLFSQQTI